MYCTPKAYFRLTMYSTPLKVEPWIYFLFIYNCIYHSTIWKLSLNKMI